MGTEAGSLKETGTIPLARETPAIDWLEAAGKDGGDSNQSDTLPCEILDYLIKQDSFPLGRRRRDLIRRILNPVLAGFVSRHVFNSFRNHLGDQTLALQ